MSVSEFVSADPTLAQTIRRHLESLRRNGTGAGLARLLEHGLDQGGALTGRHGNCASVSRLHAQLGAFASNGDNPPALRIKARVIQQHLVPYLEASPPAPVLHNPFQPYIDVINGIGTAPLPAPAESPATNLRTPPQISIGTAAGTRELPMRRPGEAASAPTSDAGTTGLSEWVEKALDDPGSETTGERRYEALRRSELNAWRAIYGVMKDFKSLKQLWVSSLDELRRERVDLEQQLTGATDRIKSVESDCERLRAELGQTRRRSAPAPRQPGAVRPGTRRAKRAMALPRRETFLQRLASEIERVRRHSGSLAVAVIGLEGLDALPASYGENAGHTVLRCYAEEILSGFRTYDFVAAYDHHRFAVLFPGTERDGAVRALAKAQKRAAETHLKVGGESLPLPAFFSAVGLLAAGEDATSLMTRVANAVEEARSVSPPHVLVAAARPVRTGPGTSV